MVSYRTGEVFVKGIIRVNDASVDEDPTHTIITDENLKNIHLHDHYSKVFAKQVTAPIPPANLVNRLIPNLFTEA